MVKSKGSVENLVNRADQIIREEKGSRAKINNLDKELLKEKIKGM